MAPRYYGALSPSPTRATVKPTRLSVLRRAACTLACAAVAPALAQHPVLRADLPEAPQPQSQLQPQSQSQAATSAPQQGPAAIRGTVLDRDGAMLPNARITLTQPTSSSVTLQTTSAADGTFTLSGIPAGPFTLTVANPGFTTETTTGTAIPNQIAQITPITLHPGVSSDVEVTLTRTEIAQDQIHDQEQQRVLGAIPNYYVSYLPHALPLTSKQKFELAWKTSIDPVSFGITAIISGFQQADDAFAGYHQGVEGYSKRYGANYADLVSGTVIGGAILPSLLHQDPRYFYKGTGTIRHRIGYAIAMSVICKGDNGHWQPNYSGIIGSLAAAGISNAYYPDSDRNGAGLTFRNTLIGTGGAAVQNIFQEFVVRHLTPRLPRNPAHTADPASPAPGIPSAPPAETSIPPSAQP